MRGGRTAVIKEPHDLYFLFEKTSKYKNLINRRRLINFFRQANKQNEKILTEEKTC